MESDLMQRGVNVTGLIPDNFSPDIARELPADPRQIFFHRFDDGNGVSARLSPYLELHRRHAVKPGQGSLFLGAVFGRTDVADADRDAVYCRDHQIIESFRNNNPPHGAKHLLARAGGHVAARYVSVLPLDGVSNGGGLETA